MEFITLIGELFISGILIYVPIFILGGVLFLAGKHIESKNMDEASCESPMDMIDDHELAKSVEMRRGGKRWATTVSLGGL